MYQIRISTLLFVSCYSLLSRFIFSVLFLCIVFKTLDIEYRFDDKISKSNKNPRQDRWRTMTFGKGGSTFRSEDRVKLPFTKPNVHGVINFFRTEVRQISSCIFLIAHVMKRQECEPVVTN